jgi:chorismate dehydratase
MVRVGAVSYLNTRPLVFGIEQGIGASRIELSYDVPSAIARQMASGEIDVGLLPVIELARIPDLEIVPGLGIVTRGPSRSVLLVARKPLDEIETVALDPHSCTSNALVRVLFAEAWGGSPRFVDGPLDFEAALAECDAAVRIGDKALFEPLPEGAEAHDLGTAWTDRTGLPFVFAVWAVRSGVLDRRLYQDLHDSRREGSRMIDPIAADYTWNGRQYPEISRRYLHENIFFRLGSAELRAMETFFEASARLGLIDEAPELRLGLQRWTRCDETAAALRRS